MTLTLTQTATAVGPGIQASFLGIGGTEPYVYSVVTGGAGGTVDASTGIYVAPATVQSDPAKLYDTVMVTDDDAATATTQILVGTPLLLFCEVLQQELGLAAGRVYLWDQKLMQPTDSGLYVAVSVPSCKPFANVNRNVNGDAEQFVSMQATVDIDIISRSSAARDRKEDVILALNSIYAQKQQEANSFYIAKLPGSRFLNISDVDGAAIPYRYRISIAMQYFYKKTKAADYFDGFEVTPYTDP